ncbi:hypothetical protein C8R43DRAFT_943365 [Mycena crocata]|nr:hypothetical protein C8R43DRAFT_943365 [Mycena crocata]
MTSPIALFVMLSRWDASSLLIYVPVTVHLSSISTYGLPKLPTRSRLAFVVPVYSNGAGSNRCPKTLTSRHRRCRYSPRNQYKGATWPRFQLNIRNPTLRIGLPSTCATRSHRNEPIPHRTFRKSISFTVLTDTIFLLLQDVFSGTRLHIHQRG